MNKFKLIIKKHNKASLDTGESKLHYKLVKGKHGWINIAMGVTITTFGILLNSNVVSADTTISNPDSQPVTQIKDQDNTQNQNISNNVENDGSQNQNNNQIALLSNNDTSKTNNTDNNIKNDDNLSKDNEKNKSVQQVSSDNNNISQNTILEQSSNELEGDLIHSDVATNESLGDSDNQETQQQLNNNYLPNRDPKYYAGWAALNQFSPDQKSMMYRAKINPYGSENELTNGEITISPVTEYQNPRGAGSYIKSDMIWISNGPVSGSNMLYTPLSESVFKSQYHVNADGSITIYDIDYNKYSGYIIAFKIGQENLNLQADAYIYASGTYTDDNGNKITKEQAQPNNPNDPVSHSDQRGISLWGSFPTIRISGNSIVYRVGDKIPSKDAFNGKIIYADGTISRNVTVNSNSVNWNQPGIYYVQIVDNESGFNWVTKTVAVTVLANKESISGKDITIYAGDKINDADFDASATDKAGNPEKITIDTSKVNINVPGTYDVTITAADGQSKIVTVTVLANKESISGKDSTIYAGDKINDADFNASATDKAGKPEKVTIDTSKVNINVPGTYDVTITAADGQSKIVKVTVLADKASISGKDLTIYAGDKINDADFDASATDKAGNPEKVTIDTSKVNINVPGTYDVTITAADGQTKIVKVTVLADKGSINGKGIIIHTGDKINNSNFGAGATDKAGNPEKVTIDTSKVNTNVPGTYNVTITAADGRTKIVTVTVLGKKGSINGNDGKHSLPQTGQKNGNWLLLLGGMMLSTFALIGIKKRRK